MKHFSLSLIYYFSVFGYLMKHSSSCLIYHISREWAQRTSKISCWTREEKFHISKPNHVSFCILDVTLNYEFLLFCSCCCRLLMILSRASWQRPVRLPNIVNLIHWKWETFSFILVGIVLVSTVRKLLSLFVGNIERRLYAEGALRCQFMLHFRSWECLFRLSPQKGISAYERKIATFRLQYEDDYEYEFSVLSMRFRFDGRKFSKCACAEL